MNASYAPRGRDFSSTQAFKYVSEMEMQLIEEDSGLTFGDDVRENSWPILEKVSGTRVLPKKRFFGGDYLHRNGSWSHSRPPLPCTPTDPGGGCEEPLKCLGGLCRQKPLPQELP